MAQTKDRPGWADWLGANARLVIGLALLLTVALAVPFLTMSPDTNASQEPGGVVFEARDTIDDRFVSSVYPVPFITEARTGNIFDKEVLAEVK